MAVARRKLRQLPLRVINYTGARLSPTTPGTLAGAAGPPPLKWAISEVTRWGRRAAAEVGDYRIDPLPPPLKWVITELTRCRRAAAEVGDYRSDPLGPPLKWVITENTRCRRR